MAETPYRLQVYISRQDRTVIGQAERLTGRKAVTVAREALLEWARGKTAPLASEEHAGRLAIRMLLKTGHHTIEDLSLVFGVTMPRPLIRAHLAAMVADGEVVEQERLSNHLTKAKKRGTQLYFLAEEAK